MLADRKDAPATPVNIGNDGEFKISELAEALTEWFPRIDVINEPLPQDDPKVRKPDLTLARSLGYKPTVPLREGLALTIEWMKERLK
jgi:UDP-glucuronate decarboxylase